LEQGRLAEAKRTMDECLAHSADSIDIARAYAQMRLRAIIDGNFAAADVAPLPDSLRPRGPVRFNLAFGDAYDALRRRDTSTALPLIAQMIAARSAIAAGPARPMTAQVLIYMQT